MSKFRESTISNSEKEFLLKCLANYNVNMTFFLRRNSASSINFYSASTEGPLRNSESLQSSLAKTGDAAPCVWGKLGTKTPPNTIPRFSLLFL